METYEYREAAMERAMKIQEIILRAIDGRITWIQAAEILRITVRHMRRIKRRYEDDGYSGLFDRRSRKPSPRRVPIERVQEVLRLYREVYFDLNVKHFHEKLIEKHGITLSYTWVKTALQMAGVIKRVSKKGKHRRRRERSPLSGMMLHLDGSRHGWLGEGSVPCDLLVIMDDATNEVYAAKLVLEEDTRSVLGLLREVVEAHGTFCSLYTDRASHFAYTPKSMQKADRRVRTQVSRALDQLGIELILAYSPQARGRSERLFGTWQGRLPQELRLAGIHTLTQANQYIKEKMIPWHNRHLTCRSRESGTAFVPATRDRFDQIFALVWERTVALDNTVQFGRRILQIPKQAFRFSFAKCRVKVYEHLDGTLSIGYGPHELGRYDCDGNLQKLSETRKAA